MDFLFIQYLNSIKQFLHCKTVSEVSSPTANTFLVSLCNSVHLVICTVNCTKNTEGIQRKKAASNSPWVSLELVFRWKKDQIYTRHCSKLSSKLPQLQNMHLNLLTVTFFVIYWLSRGILRTLIIDESELFLL